VVEASPHSLNVRNGGSGKWTAREGPVYPFFHRSHVKFSTRQGGLYMLAQLLMAQLLPLQEPCAVNVASDKE
jgi:hypothetical protein